MLLAYTRHIQHTHPCTSSDFLWTFLFQLEYNKHSVLSRLCVWMHEKQWGCGTCSWTTSGQAFRRTSLPWANGKPTHTSVFSFPVLHSSITCVFNNTNMETQLLPLSSCRSDRTSLKTLCLFNWQLHSLLHLSLHFIQGDDLFSVTIELVEIECFAVWYYIIYIIAVETLHLVCPTIQGI